MRLTDLIKLVLVKSGQLVVDDLSELHLDNEKFLLIVKNEFNKYNKYIPHTKKLNVEITASYLYKFPDTELIPKWISELVPTLGGGSSYELFTRKFFYNSSRENEVRDPQTLLWRYDRPVLYCAMLGQYEITAHYDHAFIKDVDWDTTKDGEFPTLEDTEEILIDMITAQFMITLGRSRRAYKVEGIPLVTDDSELISEGQSMYELAYQRMLDNSSWVYSMGG